MTCQIPLLLLDFLCLFPNPRAHHQLASFTLKPSHLLVVPDHFKPICRDQPSLYLSNLLLTVRLLLYNFRNHLTVFVSLAWAMLPSERPPPVLTATAVRLKHVRFKKLYSTRLFPEYGVIVFYLNKAIAEAMSLLWPTVLPISPAGVERYVRTVCTSSPQQTQVW